MLTLQKTYLACRILALFPCVTRRTGASETIGVICTGSTILTWVGHAVVRGGDSSLTSVSCEYKIDFV